MKDVTPPNEGARRGILSASSSGWLICFDSLADTNAGDKNSECCDSIGGKWIQEEGKCCASDKDNNGWVGKMGKCQSGELVVNK
ncbi:MAG: hypothetical protein AABW75_00220 [Nanoarchaeota archaeon]